MGSVPARSGPGVALSVGARPTSCQTLHVAPQRHIRDMGRREATIVGDPGRPVPRETVLPVGPHIRGQDRGVDGHRFGGRVIRQPPESRTRSMGKPSHRAEGHPGLTRVQTRAGPQQT